VKEEIGRLIMADIRVPTLGENTDQILASLGMDGDRIARLRSQGIVA